MEKHPMRISTNTCRGTMNTYPPHADTWGELGRAHNRHHTHTKPLHTPAATSSNPHHVEVGESGSCGPEDGSCLHRPQPEEVRDQQSKDGYPLVVIGTSHSTGDVSGHDSNEAGSEESCPRVPDFSCEQVCCYGRQATDKGCVSWGGGGGGGVCRGV